MKVLFVCRSNTGRSQCAEEFYNYETCTKDADSAGTIVNLELPLVGDVPAAKTLLKLLESYPIDTRNNVRTQITPEMATKYDKVISMAEPDITPEWLSNMPSFEYWEIVDMPDLSVEETKKSVDSIVLKVRHLIEEAS